MRIIDSDHAMMLKHKELQEKKMGKNALQQKPKSQKWKKQSEEFRAILKQNRIIEKEEAMGNKYTPSRGGSKTGSGSINKGISNTMNTRAYTNIPSAITDDYTLCNMCSRKYNEQAYIKHLPTCERRTKDTMMKNKLKSNTSSASAFGNKPNMNTRFKK